MAAFDFLQAGTIIAIAGILSAFIFNLFKEKRDRRKEKLEEAAKVEAQKEREENQRKAFAQEVKNTVANQANDLKERLDDKLEVIRVTTSGLQKNLEEFKTVNRDELLSIKREIERLKEEADNLNNQLQSNKIDKIEVQNKISEIMNKIETLKQRIDGMEVRISNREGFSSTA